MHLLHRAIKEKFQYTYGSRWVIRLASSGHRMRPFRFETLNLEANAYPLTL